MCVLDIAALCLDLYLAYDYAKKQNVAMTVFWCLLSLLVTLSIIARRFL